MLPCWVTGVRLTLIVSTSQGAPQMGLTMPPFKRVAVADGNLGKSGIPMYQPATLGAYHQAAIMQHLQQQPYIPVTCK